MVGFLGRSNAGVGDLFAHDGVAFAGDDLGVLKVDVMAARVFCGVLVSSDLGHNGFGSGCGRLLGVQGRGTEG